MKKVPSWWKSTGELPPLHLPLPTGPHAVGYQDVMTPGPVDEGDLGLSFKSLFFAHFN